MDIRLDIEIYALRLPNSKVKTFYLASVPGTPWGTTTVSADSPAICDTLGPDDPVPP